MTHSSMKTRVLTVLLGLVFATQLLVVAHAENTQKALPTIAAIANSVSDTAKAKSDEPKPGLCERVVFIFLDKMLNWQSFALLILTATLIYLRDEIKGLMTTGGIEVELWGQKLKFREAVAQVQKSTDVATSDLTSLTERVTELEKKAGPTKQQVAATGSSEGKIDRASKIMLEALNNVKYEWRTIGRLAELTGLSEDEATDILKSSKSKVEFATDKNGRKIARLT